MATAADMIARYARRRPDASGDPVDNGGGVAAHQWDGLWVQDVAGRGESAQSTAGREPGRVMVVLGPRDRPRLVRSDFYNVYLGAQGGTPTHVALGGPLEEEQAVDDGASQRFERGRLVWRPSTGTRVELDGRPGRKGVVGIAGGHFALDGRLFRHVGANTPRLIYDTRQDATSDLTQMREHGIEQVRAFLANERDEVGETIDRLGFCADASARLGVKLTVACAGNYAREFFNGEARRPARFVPAGDERFLVQIERFQSFTHEWFAGGYRKNYRPFVRAVVAAFRDQPSIFAWQVGNDVIGPACRGRDPFALRNRACQVSPSLWVTTHLRVVATGRHR